MTLAMFSEDVQRDYEKDFIALQKNLIEETKREARRERFTEWVTMAGLVKLTKWGRDTLEEWRDQGNFSYIKKGNKYVYDLAEVDQFLKRQREKKKGA